MSVFRDLIFYKIEFHTAENQWILFYRNMSGWIPFAAFDDYSDAFYVANGDDI